MTNCKLKALVADDTALNRQILTVFLKALDYAVICANDGMEAVAAFQAEKPDLVFMDVMMPNMGGLDAVREIRKLATSWVPILMVSALSSPEAMIEGLEAGADDYIFKPPHREVFNAKVNSITRTLMLQREIERSKESLHDYYVAAEEENAIASQILEKQLDRPGLQDPRIQYGITPATHFSGDVVSACAPTPHRLYALMADATGHGLAAAISTVPLTVMFNHLASENQPLDAIVRALNSALRSTLPVGRFLAATLLCLDEQQGVLEVWNAGMPEAMWLSHDGTEQFSCRAEHMPIGIMPSDLVDCRPCVVPVRKPGQLVLVSDGFTEAANLKGEAFGITRLQCLLKQCPPEKRFAFIQKALAHHMAGTQAHDDGSLLILSVEPKPKAG